MITPKTVALVPGPEMEDPPFDLIRVDPCDVKARLAEGWIEENSAIEGKKPEGKKPKK